MLLHPACNRGNKSNSALLLDPGVLLFPLEEEMAALSSILTWRIPWTEEPGGLGSMGSQRVSHE